MRACGRGGRIGQQGQGEEREQPEPQEDEEEPIHRAPDALSHRQSQQRSLLVSDRSGGGGGIGALGCRGGQAPGQRRRQEGGAL